MRGVPNKPANERLYPRFEARVEKRGPEECWWWLGAIAQPKQLCYGTVWGADRPGSPPRKAGAHRMAYTYWVGEIPQGMTVDHICFNTLCCNPAHLRLLTHRENAARHAPGWYDNTRNRPRKPISLACSGCGEVRVLDRNGKLYCRSCSRDRMRRIRFARNVPV